MKKTLFTLCVDNYAKDITDLTFPLMQRYADKIGADFKIITERKWPTYPAVYEKLQIHELGRGNDWNLFFDADALIHPALFDVTELLTKDTVLHCERDLAGNRFKSDDYFRRDGRFISSTNWFTVASDWCIDLWKPLEGVTLEEAVSRITPQPVEIKVGITSEHLIDDYVLSQNIARYGLKVKWFHELLEKLNCQGQNYFWHNHLLSTEDKVSLLKDKLISWHLKEPCEQINTGTESVEQAAS